MDQLAGVIELPVIHTTLGKARQFRVTQSEMGTSIVHSLMEDHGGEIVLHIHHDDSVSVLAAIHARGARIIEVAAYCHQTHARL